MNKRFETAKEIESELLAINADQLQEGVTLSVKLHSKEGLCNMAEMIVKSKCRNVPRQVRNRVECFISSLGHHFTACEYLRNFARR